MIVFTKPCAKCGVDVRSDEEHQCAQKSKPAKNPTTSPVTKTVASSVSSPSSRRTVSPPEPVSQLATSVSHPVSQLAKPKRDRTAYQRELMRKRRAATKKAPE